MAFLLLCSALLPLLSIPSVSASTCYYPDGKNVTGANICNPSAAASQCCASGDMCTTNGLCRAGNDAEINWYWRETCSDSTWQSDACPKYCYNSTTGSNAASVNHVVLACSETTYCCAYEGAEISDSSPNYSCCNDTERLFTAGVASYLGGGYFSTSLLFGTSSTATSTATSSIATSTSSAATTTAASASSSTPTTTTTSAASSGLSPGAAAGAGVGAALGGVALIALGIFAGLRMKRNKKASTTPIASESDMVERQSPPGPPPKGLFPSETTSNRSPAPRYAEAEASWPAPSELAANPDHRSELQGSTAYKSAGYSEVH